mmetsp:Transcript_22381/g.33295  ORF Transcript_22381/g.33295 Transcript_22381/m.33295 type:complete len:95 (+) Transcript_22381:324-608(+)
MSTSGKQGIREVRFLLIRPQGCFPTDKCSFLRSGSSEPFLVLQRESNERPNNGSVHVATAILEPTGFQKFGPAASPTTEATLLNRHTVMAKQHV